MLAASAVLIAISMPAIGAAGCGSGQGDAGSSSGRESPSTAAGGTEAKGASAAPSRHEEAGETGGGQANATGGEPGGGRSGGSGDARVRADRLRALGRKAAKGCPAGVSAVQCGMLVEAFAHRKQAQPHPVNAASDCLKAMSRATCEALLRAQSAAAEESGSPVNVDACMRDPTPRCEEVLGRMLEEQRASE
jgi:hypothetical protein